MSEKSYVVRIYRQQSLATPARRKGDKIVKDDANIIGRRRAYDRLDLAGTVDDVEHGVRRYFRDMEELWVILRAPPWPVAGPNTDKDTGDD
jgi:hypothetical protein